MKTEDVVVSPLNAVHSPDEIGGRWVIVAQTDTEGAWRWNNMELENTVPGLVVMGLVTTAQKRMRDQSFLLLARRP